MICIASARFSLLKKRLKNLSLCVQCHYESENRAFIDLKKAASLFPAGSYRMIAGAGHLIPMEQPKDMYTIIRDFIKEL